MLKNIYDCVFVHMPAFYKKSSMMLNHILQYSLFPYRENIAMGLLIIFGLILALVYLLHRHFFTFWKRHGFVQLDPSFPFGDAAATLTLKVSNGDFFAQLYQKHKKHRFIGTYLTYRPVLLVNDPEIVQDMLLRIFQHFTIALRL